jgi:hypothetical protein
MRAFPFIRRWFGIGTKAPPVIEAPQWLKDRMAKLRAMPPPTLEEVETQMKASAEHRKRHYGD